MTLSLDFFFLKNVMLNSYRAKRIDLREQIEESGLEIANQQLKSNTDED